MASNTASNTPSRLRAVLASGQSAELSDGVHHVYVREDEGDAETPTQFICSHAMYALPPMTRGEYDSIDELIVGEDLDEQADWQPFTFGEEA